MKIILTTCETHQEAMRLARHMVEQRFAACVNILPGITSVYPWEGKIEEAGELLLIVKTDAAKAGDARDELRRIHPFELPEIVTLDVEHASAQYRDWLEKWIWQR